MPHLIKDTYVRGFRLNPSRNGDTEIPQARECNAILVICQCNGLVYIKVVKSVPKGDRIIVDVSQFTYEKEQPHYTIHQSQLAVDFDFSTRTHRESRHEPTPSYLDSVLSHLN